MSRIPAAGDRSDVIIANHLPPIIDLGRALASNDIEYNQLDHLMGRRTVAEDQAMNLLLTRRESLWHLISTMPAMTLADAAVQIGVACHFAGTVECSDWSSPDRLERLEELAGALERICLSVLPLVAEAAGLDLAQLDWSDLDRLRASRFYGWERTA